MVLLPFSFTSEFTKVSNRKFITRIDFLFLKAQSYLGIPCTHVVGRHTSTNYGSVIFIIGINFIFVDLIEFLTLE